MSAVSGSATSLDVNWSAPANTGPAITDYDWRWKLRAGADWTEVLVTTSAATTATIIGLLADTAYDVQVRATNDEGTSGWSPSGSGTTNSPTNDAPAERLGAFVNGAKLTLVYDAELDGGSAPAAGDFAVTVNGAERTLASANPVAVRDRRVVLTLASAVGAGDSVRLTYTPGVKPIRDAANGLNAASFDVSVTTAAGDARNPRARGAWVQGTALTLVFDELLDPDSIPDAANFNVREKHGNGDERIQVTNVGVVGKRVVLTLARAVRDKTDGTGKREVSLTFLQTGASDIQDFVGNPAVAVQTDPLAVTHGEPPPDGGTPQQPPSGGGPGGGGFVISSDATLRDLAGRVGADGADFDAALTLTPSFDPDTEDYTATVPFSTTHVRLTPAVNHRGAAVQLGPRGGERTEVASGQTGPAFELAVGENVFEIEVTAEDGEETETYTVTVTRAPPPLGGLTIQAGADDADGGETLPLTPAFDAFVQDYMAAAPFDATHVRLTPTLGQPDATAKIGPRGGELAEAASGEPGPAFELAVGENVFEIEITAASGTAATYAVTVTRPPPPVPLDESAAREHLFPLLADGDGFRGRLFLTNASAYPRNPCKLELQGPGLDASRFEPHPALTAADGEIEIESGETGKGVALTTAGAGPLAFGYAKLTCAEPAVARLLLVLESANGPVALTHEASARPAHGHRFSLPPRLGRPGLVLTNDGAQAAACAVEAETAAGVEAGESGGNVAVPATATVFRFVDELVPMGEERTEGGTVTVTCDRPVAALGVPLTAGGVFAALDGAMPEAGEEAPSRRTLPLVLDGAGFRSRLEVTNRSGTANRCEMEYHGAGVNAYRFPDTEGVTRDGFYRALLELPRDGAIALTSLGRHSYAYGYAVLDCEGPADARVLLTAGGGDDARGEVAGMAQIPPARFAREFRIPVASGLERMALFLTDAGETGAMCEAALVPAGENGPETAGSPIQVEAESTELRFLADLFELPENFAGGAVALRCDGPVAAAALPFAGAAFAAVPPVVRGFRAEPNDL